MKSNVLLAFFMAGAIIVSPGLLAEDRIAFVVGNSNYSEISPLYNPKNDATDVGKRLKALGFKLHDNTVHYDLGERLFRRRFNQFANSANSAKIAFFYYAGHGMQFSGDPHILPTDIPGDDDLDTIKGDAISLEDLLKKLDGQAELTIAVFDACREIPSYRKQIRSKARGGSGWRGLGRPAVHASSTLIAYSGGFGQLVADGTGRNSPYTKILLEHLSPTVIHQNRFDVADLFGEIQYRFRQVHEGQSPEIINQGVRPNTFFLTDLPAIPEAPPPQTCGTANADYDRYSRKPNCTLARAFLDTHGNKTECFVVNAVKAGQSNLCDRQPQSAEPSPLTLIKGRDIDGHDLDILRDTSESNCRSICSKTPNCRAFSYDRWNRFCFLKDTMPSYLRVEPNSVVGVPQNVQTDQLRSSPTRIEKYRNAHFPYSAFKVIRKSSYDKCARSCMSNGLCEVFTYYRKSRACHLIENPGEYFRDKSKGADSGVKRQVAP